jgi:hypothetical protein
MQSTVLVDNLSGDEARQRMDEKLDYMNKLFRLTETVNRDLFKQLLPL